MKSILIVDDDASIRRALTIQLRGDGFEVASAERGEEAIALLKERDFDLVLLDLKLPGMNGDEVLRQIRELQLDTRVIVITAFGSIESAVRLIKGGADDYLTKPFTPEEVRHRVAQVARLRSLQDELHSMRRRLGDLPFGDDFISQNQRVLDLLTTADQVASTDATILLTGESGTGKTLLARLIHQNSNRNAGPFVTVDFASIHGNLLEAELFGVRQGAFTGATHDTSGKVGAAQGGSLFLDEIGELPTHLQSRLLRLAERHSYERLGESVERQADVRLIAATNRDLEEMVRDGSFREDLFFRLSVMEITLPPLRSRPEDILLLAKRFLEAFRTTHKVNITGWTDEVASIFVQYPWPGNVREMAHIIERAMIVASGQMITARDLPERMIRSLESPPSGELIESLSIVEERYLRHAVSQGLSLEKTAELLGIAPSTLWRKRKLYGI